MKDKCYGYFMMEFVGLKFKIYSCIFEKGYLRGLSGLLLGRKEKS